MSDRDDTDKDSAGWRTLSAWQFSVGSLAGAFLAWGSYKFESFGYGIGVLIAIFVVVAVLFSTAVLVVHLGRNNRCIRDAVNELQILRAINIVSTLKNAKEEAKWVIEKKVVAELEVSSKVTELWTLTPDFHYEINDFDDVVIQNICQSIGGKKRMCYTYIYPNVTTATSKLDLLRCTVLEAVAKKLNLTDLQTLAEEINECFSLYPIKQDIVLYTEGLQNPHERRPLGLLMTPGEAFPYYIKLDENQTHRLRVKFEEMIRLSREDFPTTEKFLSIEFVKDCLRRQGNQRKERHV